MLTTATRLATGGRARQKLPGRLRGSLSLESGVNDGLAFLPVTLPLSVPGHSGGIGATRAWLVDGLLLAAAMGAALGCGAAVLLGLAFLGWFGRVGVAALFFLGAACAARAQRLRKRRVASSI